MPYFKPQLLLEAPLEKIERYITDRRWVFEQKLDGVFISLRPHGSARAGRQSTRHHSGSVQRNPNGSASWFHNRQGQQAGSPLKPELLRAVESLYGSNVVIDGEHVDGTLHIFDMPYAAGLITPDTPFEKRREALVNFYNIWKPPSVIQLVYQATDEAEKTALLDTAIQNHFEGVVAKQRGGRYSPGRRNNDVLKFKFVKELDAIVTGIGADGKSSYTFSVLDNGKLVEICKCSSIGKLEMPMGSVATIRYLYASDDRRLVQPRIVRFRDDKPAADCGIDQLQYTNKKALAHA